MTEYETIRLEGLLAGAEASATRLQQQDSPRELKTRCYICQHLVQIAVRKHREDGLRFLRSSAAKVHLERILETSTHQGARLAQHEGLIALGLAVLISRDVEARLLSDRIAHSTVPFWNSYQDLVRCLLDGHIYEAPPMEFAGYHRYFGPYLQFGEALSKGHPLENVRDKVVEVFQQRNRDKRIVDPLMVDGDGRQPVRWDFRLSVLEALVALVRGAAIN